MVNKIKHCLTWLHQGDTSKAFRLTHRKNKWIIKKTYFFKDFIKWWFPQNTKWIFKKPFLILKVFTELKIVHQKTMVNSFGGSKGLCDSIMYQSLYAYFTLTITGSHNVVRDKGEVNRTKRSVVWIPRWTGEYYTFWPLCATNRLD